MWAIFAGHGFDQIPTLIELRCAVEDEANIVRAIQNAETDKVEEYKPGNEHRIWKHYKVTRFRELVTYADGTTYQRKDLEFWSAKRIEVIPPEHLGSGSWDVPF